MQHKLIVLLYWYELDNILYPTEKAGKTKEKFKEQAQRGFDPCWTTVEGSVLTIDKEVIIEDELSYQLVSCHFSGHSKKEIPQAAYAAIGRGTPEVSQAEGLRLWKEAIRERKLNNGSI